MKKGVAVALKPDVVSAATQSGFQLIKPSELCQSDVGTPGQKNVCVTFLPLKQAPDADRDFLPDDRETWRYGSDPLNPDTDSDGWLDGFEVESG